MSPTPDSPAPVAPAKGRRTRRWAWLAVAAIGALAIGIAGWYFLYRQGIERNFATVVEARVYRSAQPSASDLVAWKARYGLKTVVNLRGAGDGSRGEGKDAADAGLELIELRCSAQDLPSSLWVRGLIEALETARQPLLIHCKAGSDRTGVASVMAAMAIGNQRYSDARSQLSLKYGHVSEDAAKIAGLLTMYEQYCKAQGADTGGWQEFRAWATDIYHPGYYFVEISTPRSLVVRPGQRIEADVTVTNRSPVAIPAGHSAEGFYLACFAGSSVQEKPDAEYAPRVRLPDRDIPPGQSVTVRCPITIPPGAVGPVHFDLIEEHKTFFARQGSPMATLPLADAASSMSASGQAAPE
jgi:protein tyrosine phosphatase (PTP) superfamily phosphohydrolase (DUF442 family)